MEEVFPEGKTEVELVEDWRFYISISRYIHVFW